MSIAQNLSKLGLGVNAQGVLSAAKGGTGGSSGGGSSSSPTITAITYPGNDTAVDTAGGNTVTLTGTNFNIGVNIVINGVSAPVVTRVSSTEVTFTTPAQPAGSYIVYAVNTDGTTGLAVPGIQYSAVPVWTTAAGNLGSVLKSTNFSATLVSTGDAPVSYSIVSGTLPGQITLNSSTGVLSGNAPEVVNSTTYNFTVRSTDAQGQDTDRAFSLTVIPTNPTPTVEYLVVAGGGGGGTCGGGGGAGGYRTATQFPVSFGVPIVVTVGAGGTATAGGSTPGVNGSNSVFDSITAIGGGGGASNMSPNAPNGGGSGGGAASAGTGGTGGTGTAGQGNNGGANYASAAKFGGGGGGGAGAAGQNGTISKGGDGGIGLQSSISGTATYYAGGGGGGSQQNGGGGAGGLGGGSSGTGNSSTPTAATANLGGGGGGSGYTTGYTLGGTGGSGVVIIRYSDTYTEAPATTGSPTVTVAGGYRVYKWTSSGSITF